MKQTKSLGKGLKALGFLAAAGSATVRELAMGLQIPEQTAARLLETLRTEGFALRVRPRQKYWATTKLHLLSKSVPPLALIVDAAGPHLDEITAALEVPAMICAASPTQRVEVLRANTRAVKRTITRFVPGYTFPPAGTASGLVLQAFGGQVATESIRTGAAKAGIDDLRIVARDGYAIRADRWEKREGCLSVPILLEGRAVAALEVRYIKAVVSEGVVRKRFLPLLRRHARRLSEAARIAPASSPTL
jgi:DNA-binding IclR family transcriptional regulator